MTKTIVIAGCLGAMGGAFTFRFMYTEADLPCAK